MMTGSFDSSAQEAMDSSYYNISLHMYEIWEDQPGTWIYVEQAVSAMQDKPYRQRVYHLSIQNDIVASKVYALNEPERFVNKWKSPDFFNDFTASNLLTAREGCTVYLQKQGSTYHGSTKDRECKSTLRDATYATSIVTVKKDVIESWDQGFDDSGEQKWGATKGPYIFKRL